MTASTIRSHLLTELLDREAIRDCQMRYSHGIDRRDRALLESVYWPEAIDDHAQFVGSASEFIEHVLVLLSGVRQTSHFIGNILMRIDGTVAHVQSHFQAYHCYRGSLSRDGARGEELSQDGPLTNDLLGGRYLDLMEKRSGEWRILHRKVMFDWYHAAELAAANWEDGFMGFADRIGASGTHDESSRLFGETLRQGLKV